MPNQNNNSTGTTAQPPDVQSVISPQVDLPPLSPDFQSVGNDTGGPAPQAPAGSAPPMVPPVISSGPKKKFGGGRVIATILGILLLVGGVGAGLLLTQQQQLFQQKAAPSGTVLENSILKVTVVDTGPGNYESNTQFKAGGQTDTRPVEGNTITQIYTIQNKTASPHTVKLISFPYKMYTVGAIGTTQCVDLYTPAQINSFVQNVGGNDLQAAYKAFADRFYAGVPGAGGHCYDTPANAGEQDPSVGQRRYLGPGPGGLTCNYLKTQNIKCADSQTLVTVGKSPTYLSSQSVSLAANQTKQNVSLSITNTTCGFYQFDHGFQIDGGGPIFWVGSEIKFFPCSIPSTPTPTIAPTVAPTVAPTITPTTPPAPGVVTAMCISVKAYSGSSTTPLTDAQLSALHPGSTVNFCVLGSQTAPGGGTGPAFPGSFDQAQFSINGSSKAMINVTAANASSRGVCQSYTIGSTDSTVNVKAKIHNTAAGWVGETF